MNRFFFLMGLLFILVIPQAWGASSQYPNPYRQTMWNSFTDTLHTVGQSPRQAGLTKMRLHEQRTLTRLNSIKQAKRRAWMNNTNYQ